MSLTAAPAAAGVLHQQLLLPWFATVARSYEGSYKGYGKGPPQACYSCYGFRKGGSCQSACKEAPPFQGASALTKVLAEKRL